jgi:hypothetical protein
MKDMLKQIQLLVLPIVWNACETWCQMVVHDFLLKTQGGIDNSNPIKPKSRRKDEYYYILGWVFSNHR